MIDTQDVQRREGSEAKCGAKSSDIGNCLANGSQNAGDLDFTSDLKFLQDQPVKVFTVAAARLLGKTRPVINFPRFNKKKESFHVSR